MSGTSVDQIQWMIRKPLQSEKGGPSGFTVMGPFLTDQVRTMLTGGLLEADDELCPENSYWFGLNELVEVKRFLGLDQFAVARASGADAESTQPDFEATQPEFEVPGGVADENTPPGIEPAALAAAEAGDGSTGMISIKRPIPAAPAAASSPKPATAPASKPAKPTGRPVPAPAPSAQELAQRFQRVAPAKPLAYTNPIEEQPKQVLGFEKGQFWTLLIIAGIILAVLGILWILRSIRSLPS